MKRKIVTMIILITMLLVQGYVVFTSDKHVAIYTPKVNNRQDLVRASQERWQNQSSQAPQSKTPAQLSLVQQNPSSSAMTLIPSAAEVTLSANQLEVVKEPSVPLYQTVPLSKQAVYSKAIDMSQLSVARNIDKGTQVAVYVPEQPVQGLLLEEMLPQARNVRLVTDDFVRRNPVQHATAEKEDGYFPASSTSDEIFAEAIDENLLRQEQAESTMPKEAKKSFWQRFLDYTSRRKDQASSMAVDEILMDIWYDAQDVDYVYFPLEMRTKWDNFEAKLRYFTEMSLKDSTQIKYTEFVDFANSFKDFETSAKTYKPEQLRRWNITSFLHKVADFFTLMFSWDKAPVVFAEPIPVSPTLQTPTKNMPASSGLFV
jgi:hypothetical protein